MSMMMMMVLMMIPPQLVYMDPLFYPRLVTAMDDGDLKEKDDVMMVRII